MRVTFTSQGRNTIEHLREVQARKQRATNEVSSGRRVTKPSDSPADAAGIIRTRRDLAQLQQFRGNLEATRAELQAVDAALFEAGSVLNRALSLATQAATSTQEAETRDLIRVEIEAIFRHMVSIANTAHSNRYVFAGNLDDHLPFFFDAASPDGAIYAGDAQNRSLSFPDGQPAQISLPGDEIFLTPDTFTGAGRTAETPGAAVPNPPVGIGIAFSGDVEAVISTDLGSFFVAPAAPGVPGGGEQITVDFTSADVPASIQTSIVTPPLAGGETTADIASLLNAEIANNPALVGGFTFVDEGGVLKLVQSDTLGVGFSFASSATGGLTSGLEGGGATGGQSAGEIAAALNAAAAQNPHLQAANIRFRAVGGQVEVDGDVDFTFTAVDFHRGAGFASGLAGTHRVGGRGSANILGALHRLAERLGDDDQDAIAESVRDLQRSQDHLSRSQGFYGGTLRQVNVTLESLSRLEVVHESRLSDHQDADLVDAISRLTTSTTAEQFVLQVAARRQPTVLDFLA